MSFLLNLFDGGASAAAQAQEQAIQQGLNQATNYTNQANSALTSNYNAALPYFTSLFGTGQQGLTQLGNVLGLNGPAGSSNALSTLQSTPGYQFTKQQGDSAINAAAAANGTLNSGNQKIALSNYDSGLASQTYNNYVNQLQPYMNLATSGASGAGNVLTGLGSGLSSNLTGLGQDYLQGNAAIGGAEANADLAGYGSIDSLIKGIAGLGTNTIGGGLLSSLGGSLSSMFSPIGAGAVFSDERLKEDIAEVGELFDGQKVYSYKYKGDHVPRIGLMAQEVEQRYPDAVTEIGGFKAVNYGEATDYAAELGKLFKDAA